MLYRSPPEVSVRASARALLARRFSSPCCIRCPGAAWTHPAVVLLTLLALSCGCKEGAFRSAVAVPSREAATDPEEIESRGEATGAALFVDRAHTAGVRFTPANGEEADRKTILETLGVGVAMLDYDHDGDLDLIFPGGGTLGDHGPAGRSPAMFRNGGDWRYADVTAPAGLVDVSLYTHAAITGDYDADGFSDLLITGYHGLRLYRNQGDGTFHEVTASARLKRQAWSTSAAWGDLNGDGTLDLYVVNYVDWSFDRSQPCLVPWGSGSLVLEDTCGPEQYDGLTDWLFLGDGRGGFEEVGSASGLVEGGKGLAVLLGDVDLDGDLDIYVANDSTPNFLYLNRGDAMFDEAGLASGTALGETARPDGSMGVDLADFDRDGLPDLWVTNYEQQSFALYRNRGDGYFQHVSSRSGITSVGHRFVGFGTCFFDFDQDGDEDLFAATGHVKQVARLGDFQQYPLLFENRGGKRFVNIAPQAGDYTRSRHMGRGVAVGDLDNDGDLDLAVAHTNQPVALLSNDTARAGNWLQLKLIGRTSHRDAVGGRIILQTAEGRQTKQVKGGTSYLSTSDLRVHFGLGPATIAEQVIIHWPSGRQQRLVNVSANQLLMVHEPGE